jgi:hypothetical protein
MFDMIINRKRVWWEWAVCDAAGTPIIFGRELSRPAARYKAARALFQLLLTTSQRTAQSPS